ncbi:MAG: leucine-rich repeat domain-containing protein, partial [Snowella sp.]
KIIEQAAEDGRQDLRLLSGRLTELPKEIFKLNNLTGLYLGFNQISEIPDEIAELKNLTTLTLFSNQISEIPDAIAKLKNLKKLSLSDNKISRIPDVIAELKNLGWLDLENNQISEIPDAIMKLKNLVELNVSGNPITTPPVKIANEGIYPIRAYFADQQLSYYQDNNPLKLERSIEFPPEYWTAGTSILSYFTHILNLKYPNQNIKVRIEQEGLLLRMVIDTPEGTTETIEQAFNDYVMVISRKLPPESLLTDPFEVMALKNKLQIAEMELRISRENFVAFKDDSRQRINSLEIQINQFYSLFGKMIENLPHNPIYMNQFTNHNQNSNIANLANQINDHGQQNANHFNQNQDKNIAEILQIIDNLRQITGCD